MQHHRVSKSKNSQCFPIVVWSVICGSGIKAAFANTTLFLLLHCFHLKNNSEKNRTKFANRDLKKTLFLFIIKYIFFYRFYYNMLQFFEELAKNFRKFLCAQNWFKYNKLCKVVNYFVNNRFFDLKLYFIFICFK